MRAVLRAPGDGASYETNMIIGHFRRVRSPAACANGSAIGRTVRESFG